MKASISEGWNNLVHSSILFNTFKPRFFADIVPMSTQLLSSHFGFFYTNLKPIDDNLQSSIDSFSTINLTDSSMIGHMISIKKIIDDYQTRLMLYKANSLIDS